jgi:AraC-like DNA-binding protein/mannose-6-phosphate isomerase-like protein (cupin superfamily)
MSAGRMAANTIANPPQAGQPPGSHPVAFYRWESPFTPDLFFIESSDMQLSYPAHVHDVMEILWVRAGHAVLACRDRCYPMGPGDAVIIAPNEVHAGGSSGLSHFSFSSLHVPRAAIAALAGFQGADEDQSWPMPAAHLVSGRCAEELYRDLIGGLLATRSRADEIACLGDVIGRLFRAPFANAGTVVPAADSHPAIRRAKSIINAEFTEPIDMSRLADEVNLHQRYLIPLFKTATGIPPHQYQMALRVDLGRKLLERKLSLCTIASAAGFADQSHFNRLFKRTYSMTPGIFRAQTIPI